MTKKRDIGDKGEEIASNYLIKNGWKIIERNFRKPWGEIDIIAKDKKGILVFVEVKTMNKNENIKPEDNLTKSKLEKLKRTSSGYAAAHNDLLGKRGWRIDLIAIDILTDINKDVIDFSIRHFENIA